MKDNYCIIQFFEWYCSPDIHLWKKFRQQINFLVSLGISAAWLPPAYKGTKGVVSEGYDVYDLYDLGEFHQKGSVSTKYGTRQDYVSAVHEARKAGLKIYIDVVLNHMGGGDETEKIKVVKVDPENRNRRMSEEMEIEAYTLFNFPARKNKYSSFRWNHKHFTGIDHAVGVEESAIYNIQNGYEENWEPLINSEKGNFDYLMFNDIETRNPEVREELKRWISWYYRQVPFDGVRLDAVKHINPSFFTEWLDHVRATIHPEIFAVGEYWLSDDLNVLLKYIEVTSRKMSLLDAPLHHNLVQASRDKAGYDLRTIFDNTLVKADPLLAVTFVDNHDTQPLQALEEFTESWFRPHAYTLILLREAGYPCVFYPDLYGCAYEGKNKAGEQVQIQIPVLPELAALLRLRKQYAYGEQYEYLDDAKCIGWTRGGHIDKMNSGCAVLLSSADTPFSKRMFIGEQFAGKIFYDYIHADSPAVVIDKDGKGEFTVPAGHISVWIKGCE